MRHSLLLLLCLAVGRPALAQDVIAIAGVVITQAGGLSVPWTVVSIAEGSYQVGPYRLAVGAHNVFSVLPDRSSTANSFNGIQTFPSHSPFGMNGRTVCARAGAAC